MLESPCASVSITNAHVLGFGLLNDLQSLDAHWRAENCATVNRHGEIERVDCHIVQEHWYKLADFRS